MFLHIGGSRVLAAKEIIGIFNISIKDKQCNKEFLQTVRSYENNSDDDTKAFIITQRGVSFSPIAPSTLKKRFQENLFDK